MKTLLIAAIFLASCTTGRELQIQKGTYTAYPDGHVRFTASSEWQKIPFDTTFNGFLVRNTKIKKP